MNTPPPSTLPNTPDLLRAEREARRIDARRAHWQQDPLVKDPALVALAFSGGGIRSATFALGFTQALASPAAPYAAGGKQPMLARADLMSTVSGGGYLGSFLGTLFLPRRFGLGTVPDPDRGEPATESPLDAARRTLELLNDPPQQDTAAVGPGSLPGAGREPSRVFHPVRWLRENGRYLTPGGGGDRITMAAFYLRALAGVHYVLALMLLAAMTLAYLGRLLLHAVGEMAGVGVPGALSALDWSVLLSAREFSFWGSPLIVVPVWLVAVVVGPLVLAYWSVYRQDKRTHRSLAERVIEFGPFIAAAGAAVVGALLWTQGARNTWLVPFLAYVFYLGLGAGLLRLLWLDPQMRKAVQADAQGDVPPWRTISGLVQDARLKLTQALAAVLRVVLLVLAVALVDSLAQTVFVAVLRGKPAELFALFSSGGAAALLLFVARKLAGLAGGKGGLAEAVARFAKPIALLAAVAVLTLLAALAGAGVQAVLWSTELARLPPGSSAFVPQMAGWHLWLLGGLIVVLAVLLVMTGVAMGFLNNSTLHRFYAARLRRTFLGAANFARLTQFAQAVGEASTEGKAVQQFFVSESHPDDDVSLRSYFGAAHGGPLHLINVNLNERLSLTSALVRDDRRGVSLAVGPAGLQVGGRFFAWAQSGQAGSPIGSRIDVAAGPPAAADEAAASAAAECERLPLSSWVAISGAAVGTGLGRLSSTGFSMLTWLVNARLAYWWKAAPAMSTQRRGTPTGVFDLVWQEMSGGFYGQRDLRWNLSDGGHFENTAVYELLRRRAALIVCTDSGADPHYDFNDLQNLVRRARIDFGAELRVLTAQEAHERAEQYCKPLAGPHTAFAGLPDFKQPDVRARACALLAEVSYPEGESQVIRSLLVLVKPTLLERAPVDVQLYARGQPLFPQQGTGDQFFDEAQWESYRRLGQTAGELLAPYWPGLLAYAQDLRKQPSPAATSA